MPSATRPSATRTTDVVGRRARIAVLVHFLVNGAGLGIWAARLPALRDELGLTVGDIGTVLFIGGLAAVLMLRIAGPVIERHGSRRVTQIAGVLGMLAFAAPAAATSFATLVVAMLLITSAISFQDVGMNSQGIAMERRWERPLMSSFHAAFSVGLAGGAALGGAAAELGITYRTTFVAGALLWLAAVLAVNPWLLRDPGKGRQDRAEKKARGPLPHRALLIALGVIGFASFIGEGAAVDWTALYLTDETGAREGVAAVGVVAFSTAMVVGRLAGDRLAARFGALPLIAVGTGVAGSSLALGVLVGGTWVGIAAFAFVGIGLSIVVPQVFAAAGTLAPERTASALSLVSMLSYTGFLLGPATIGRLAEWWTIGQALLLPATLVLGATLIAVRLLTVTDSPLRPRRPAHADEPPLEPAVP